MANREGYTCAIKLTDNDSTCTCNIPQLKLPREHVIATCAKEKGCVNISMYSLCAWWYIVENYPKTYVGLFHPIPDPRTWVEYNRPMILPPEFRRPASRPLLFAYAPPWMKSAKVINAIGVAIANNLFIISPVAATSRHQLLLDKYVYDYVCK